MSCRWAQPFPSRTSSCPNHCTDGRTTWRREERLRQERDHGRSDQCSRDRVHERPGEERQAGARGRSFLISLDRSFLLTTSRPFLIPMGHSFLISMGRSTHPCLAGSLLPCLAGSFLPYSDRSFLFYRWVAPSICGWVVPSSFRRVAPSFIWLSRSFLIKLGHSFPY